MTCLSVSVSPPASRRKKWGICLRQHKGGARRFPPTRPFTLFTFDDYFHHRMNTRKAPTRGKLCPPGKLRPKRKDSTFSKTRAFLGNWTWLRIATLSSTAFALTRDVDHHVDRTSRGLSNCPKRGIYPGCARLNIRWNSPFAKIVPSGFFFFFFHRG